MEKAKVYFTWEITPSSLIKIYEVLGTPLTGKVGVKYQLENEDLRAI